MHTDMRIEEELYMMDTYGLTASELLFAKILLINKEDGYGHDLVLRYMQVNESVRGKVKDMLKSLLAKHVITNESTIPEEGALSPEDVVFNKVFLSRFFKSSFSLGKDLLGHYPLSTIVNGVEYKLRRVSKKFNSLEEAYFAYGKAIGWKEDKHAEVIRLVEAGKRSGYQFSTVDAFIVDHDWENIKAMQEAGQLSENMRML